jgi:bisphosphoglycerate-independent phosphoglycerate mutase (AlkP superfamily)
VVDPTGRVPKRRPAALPSVAPTVLRLLGLPAGERMTAEPLV